jgi:glycosyltransferase involved in cell wall biosynthesis
MEVPIILGVDGEAKSLFIEEGKCGLYFEPENVNELTKCIEFVINNTNAAKQLGVNGRSYVNLNFNRTLIAEKLLKTLNQL